MDETVREIETHIGRTRDQLGSNLKELEQKVDAATNWREQFRTRPYVLLGAACIGGALLAAALRPRIRPRAFDRRTRAFDGSNGWTPGALSRTGVGAHGYAFELWQNMQTALIGLGAARLKEYIGEIVPGFAEHLRRAEERRRLAAGTSTVDFGRASR